MRINFIAYLLLGWLACTGSAWGQCRMTDADLSPVISRHNPFFTDHNWEPASKTETVRMDPMRLLVIRQKACMRHHILFTMHIDQSVIENSDRFWITETLVMFKRVFFHDPEYPTYKTKFEREFVRYFTVNGLNKSFTFPVDDRTFICRIESGSWGAKIKVESVKYVLDRAVKMPGISREQDDGWYRQKE